MLAGTFWPSKSDGRLSVTIPHGTMRAHLNPESPHCSDGKRSFTLAAGMTGFGRGGDNRIRLFLKTPTMTPPVHC